MLNKDNDRKCSVEKMLVVMNLMSFSPRQTDWWYIATRKLSKFDYIIFILFNFFAQETQVDARRNRESIN
jgi:hypothetical protein